MDGLGDTSLGLWYETIKGSMCVSKVDKAADLLPATYLGFILILPTEISPYDEIENNFNTTGRGMYRLDGNISIEKSISAWTATLKYSLDKYLSRDIN